MKIINGKRIYNKDLYQLRKIDGNGWDTYNGQNHQWYSLYAAILDDSTILYKLDASNSGDCYGDYSTRYFVSADSFVNYIANKFPYVNAVAKIGHLLGEIDETDELVESVLKDLGI